MEITHDGAAQLKEVFLVAHFLGEEVSWVECTWDVDWLHFSQLDRFADTALADVELGSRSLLLEVASSSPRAVLLRPSNGPCASSHEWEAHA
jgi:hypothetical protein